MSAYTTASLLTDVKLRVFIPTSQETFEDSDLLRLADAEMQTTVIPLLSLLRAEYYVAQKDHTITQGTAAYQIPARAVGMQLRDVQIVGADGSVRDVPMIDPETVDTTATGTPESCYLRMNQVVLYPTPNATTGTLRLSYFLRPSSLVETLSAAAITVIDTGTSTVTASSLPSAWSTADTFDLIKGDGASEPLAIDQVAGAVGGTDITFSSLPTGLAVGDYVALAGQSPLLQLPAELRPVLAQCVAVRVCESMNLPGLESARKSLDAMLKSAQALFTPRVVGAPKKLVQRRGWL